MTPRSHEGQRVTTWRIDVDPDCTLKSGEDHFGNLTHTLTVPGVLSDMTITAQGELTCFDALGVVKGTAERLPLDLYRRDTAFTTADPALSAFASEVTSSAKDGISRLHALLGAIHEAVAVTEESREIQTAAQAFAAKAGSSADHAQIFAACARRIGHPARCATGFFLVEHGKSLRHLWAEAYVNDLGWVGFDTVNDICPQDNHVRVAVGLDALDAAAVRGTPCESVVEDVSVSWLFGRDQADRPRSSQSQGQS